MRDHKKHSEDWIAYRVKSFKKGAHLIKKECWYEQGLRAGLEENVAMRKIMADQAEQIAFLNDNSKLAKDLHGAQMELGVAEELVESLKRSVERNGQRAAEYQEKLSKQIDFALDSEILKITLMLKLTKLQAALVRAVRVMESHAEAAKHGSYDMSGLRAGAENALRDLEESKV